MKKIVFGVIATVVLGFAGNAQTKEVEPALSTEYYNYVFDLSEISESAHVLNVSNLTDEEYTSYGKLISDVNFNLQKFTFKMEVQKDDVKKTKFGTVGAVCLYNDSLAAATDSLDCLLYLLLSKNWTAVTLESIHCLIYRPHLQF